MRFLTSPLFAALLVVFFNFAPLFAAEPVPDKGVALQYTLCGIEKFPLPGSSIYKMKIIIAPQEDDLSIFSNKQIAATAYAAMCNYEKDPDALLVNVLLFERCGGDVMLSRAQVGDGRRVAWGNKDKGHGPREELIQVSKALGKVKNGQGTTTDIDYTNAGKIMGISGSRAKELHLELVGYMGFSDFYDKVKGTPPLKPISKK